MRRFAKSRIQKPDGKLNSMLMPIVELVSEELNHLAAILHVYAGGVDFYEVKKNCIFQKGNGNTLTLLIIILVKSIPKEQIAQITQYYP